MLFCLLLPVLPIFSKMEDRVWHSDPMFSYEGNESDGTVQRTPDGLDNGSFVPMLFSSPQPNTSRSPALSRTYTLNSASRSGRKDISGSGRKKSVYSTKELDETISRLQKENFNLRIRIQVMEQRMNDDSVMEDSDNPRPSVQTCVDYEMRLKEMADELLLRRQELDIKEDELRELRYAREQETLITSGNGYLSPSKGTKSRSPNPPVSVGFPSSVIYDSASRKKAAQMTEDAREDELEAARLAGYKQAMRDMEEARQEMEAQKGTDIVHDAEEKSVTGDSAQKDLDVTDYPKFPSRETGRTSSPITTPFPSTRAVSISITQTSPESFPRMDKTDATLVRGTPERLRISQIQKDTFGMLLTRLQELVTFFNRALNGSFDLSDTSLNVSMAKLEATNLDISLVVADIGSGDGNHVSFSLATRLQELIDISKELSLRDVEVETDDHWQEEKEAMATQLTDMKLTMEIAQKAAESAVAENARLLAQMEVEHYENQQKYNAVQLEKQRVKFDLEEAVTMKSSLEKELTELLERINMFEEEMAQTRASQRSIRENFAPRPTESACHGTDLSVEDIVTLEREAEKSAQSSAVFCGEVGSLRGVLAVRDEQIGVLQMQLQHDCRLLEDLKVDLERKKNMVEVYQVEADRDAEKMESLRKECDEYADTVRTLESELENHEELIERLEKQAETTAGSVQLVEENRLKIANLTAEVDSSLGVITKLRNENEDKCRMMELAEKHAEASSKRADALTRQLQALGNAKKQLEARLDEFSKEMDRFEAVEKEKKELEHELEDLQERLGKTEEELEGYQTRLGDKEYEFGEYRSAVESRIEDLMVKLSRSADEAALNAKIQQNLQADLHSAAVQIASLKGSLQQSEEAADSERQHHRELALKKMRTDLEKSQKAAASQQTDLAWSDIKADRAGMLRKIEMLVDEVEKLETVLKETRTASDQALDYKNRSYLAATSRLDAVSSEASRLLDENEKLDSHLAALSSQLAEADERYRALEEERDMLLANQENIKAKEANLAKWEKAVQRQIGKTQKVIDQANQNMAGISRGGASRSSHPLTERHSAPRSHHNS